MADSNHVFSDFLPHQSTRRLCSKELSMLEPYSSINLSNHGIVTLSLKQGFQNNGKVFNLLESLYQSGSTELIIVNYVAVINGHFEVWNHELSIQKPTDKKVTMLYDAISNICFFFQEPSREQRLIQTNQNVVDMFTLCLNNQDDRIDVDLSSKVPQRQLFYTNINLFNYKLVKGGSFVAVFGNGYEYGHKRTHVDYSEGFVIDLIPYNKDMFLQPTLRFSVDVYTHVIGFSSRFIETTFYVDKFKRKLFCYLDFYKQSLNYVCEFQINQPNCDCIAYTINADTSKKISFFEHCDRNQFIYVSEGDATILRLHDKHVQIVNEISLKINDEIPFVDSFSLYNRIGNMLLCMQYPSLILRIFDLNNGKLSFSMEQENSFENISLNWNMYELLCTRFYDRGLSLDVYDIGMMDISLKNLSRLALLKSFSKSELLKMPMPLHLKTYLDLV